MERALEVSLPVDGDGDGDEILWAGVAVAVGVKGGCCCWDVVLALAAYEVCRGFPKVSLDL